MNLEQNTRRPEALQLEQAGLTYAFRNYKTAEDLSFEEILNSGLEKPKAVSVKTEGGFTLVDHNEGAKTLLEAVHREYDIREKYSRTLVEKLGETSRAIRESEDVQYIDIDGRQVKHQKKFYKTLINLL